MYNIFRLHKQKVKTQAHHWLISLLLNNHQFRALQVLHLHWLLLAQEAIVLSWKLTIHGKRTVLYPKLLAHQVIVNHVAFLWWQWSPHQNNIYHLQVVALLSPSPQIQVLVIMISPTVNIHFLWCMKHKMKIHLFKEYKKHSYNL